jgi:hypothetical protein
MRTQIDDIRDDASEICRQIDSLRDSANYDSGVNETRHRELMDYLMTIKMESESRDSSIKHILYVILAVLCVIAFKLP